MFNYFAYGLGIASNVAIPEFAVAAAASDVEIILDPNFVSQDVVIEETIQLTIKITHSKSYVFDRLVGTFYIEDGNKVVVVPAPNASIEQVRIYIVGTIMAIILYQRGLLVMHASSVVIDGKAVIFVGRSGGGKSAIAAALNQKGYPLVSDDAVPVDLTSAIPLVYPGFGQYKLSEATAEVLGHQSNALLNRDVENRGFINCQKFSTQSLPISQVYILEKDSPQEIVPIRPREVITQLLCYLIPTIWGMSQTPAQFFQCSKIAQTTPFYTLHRGDDISALPQLADLVENHVRVTAIAPKPVALR
ncbi:MAG: hypothetical protein AAFO95_08060 [Cyanobacteria bacterium J06600_6]